jgi:hypothetical protein
METRDLAILARHSRITTVARTPRSARRAILGERSLLWVHENHVAGQGLGPGLGAHCHRQLALVQLDECVLLDQVEIAAVRKLGYEAFRARRQRPDHQPANN